MLARQELVAAAESAVLLGWVAGLMHHVGDGLAPTDKGNLKVADGNARVAALDTDDLFDEVMGTQILATRSNEDRPDVDLPFRVASTSAAPANSSAARTRCGSAPTAGAAGAGR